MCVNLYRDAKLQKFVWLCSIAYSMPNPVFIIYIMCNLFVCFVGWLVGWVL